LLDSAETLSNETIPAKKWLEERKKNIRKSLVPFTGDLTFIERAKIANWFEEHIAQRDPKKRQKWLGLLPIAHAHTIVIASRLGAETPNDESGSSSDKDSEKPEETVCKAWRKQMEMAPSPWSEVDVDLLCLEGLEEQMFERSALAGNAGHWQWGLDAEHHQDGWNPYAGIPDHWNHRDRESESEGELQVSKIYRYVQPETVSDLIGNVI
jgi:hypothetical protein